MGIIVVSGQLRTLFSMPEGVRLRESWLYFVSWKANTVEKSSHHPADNPSEEEEEEEQSLRQVGPNSIHLFVLFVIFVRLFFLQNNNKFVSFGTTGHRFN